MIGPPIPRSFASFAQRSASMITPAEFGESQTSSFISIVRGTSPKLRPSRRIIAHLRSSSHGTWSLGPMWMDLLGQRLVELGLHGLRLRDLLRRQALALEHVHEVHVAAEVQLVGAVELDATVLEELGEDAVRDRGADLRLDVVAHDRHPGVGELLGPDRVARDEHRQRVHEGDPGIDRALRVVACRPAPIRPAGRRSARRRACRGAPARRRPRLSRTP